MTPEQRAELDRIDPILPLSPGRAERHGFEYYRHGTLSLYVETQPRRREIHIIVDNLSAHKTQKVRTFLRYIKQYKTAKPFRWAHATSCVT